MARLLTDDKGNRYIHCELLEEIIDYPQGEYIVAEGDSYRLGETPQDPDPNGGWTVALEPAERPDGVGPLHVMFVTGE